jgi:hypothetical protein
MVSLRDFDDWERYSKKQSADAVPTAAAGRAAAGWSPANRWNPIAEL